MFILFHTMSQNYLSGQMFLKRWGNNGYFLQQSYCQNTPITWSAFRQELSTNFDTKPRHIVFLAAAAADITGGKSSQKTMAF